jgi:hypothetical protein
MRNEPQRDMWCQNLWAHSRYVKRVLVQLPRADAIVEAVSGRCGRPGPEVRQLTLRARGQRRKERKLPSMTCPGRPSRTMP